MNWHPTPEQIEHLTGASTLADSPESEVVYDMPDREYRKRGGVSQSFLKQLKPMPGNAASCFWKEDKPHFRFGRLVHHAILTPWDPLPTISVYPDKYGPEKKPWNMNANECKAWVAKEEAAGRTPMTRAEYANLMGVIKSISEHPVAREIFAEGKAEVSAFRKLRVNGTEFLTKIRPDWVPPGRSLWDIKTTGKGGSSAREFRKALRHTEFGGLGYGFQAAHYLGNWNAVCRDDARDMFGWIVVEKEYPFAVKFYRLYWHQLEFYAREVEEALVTFAGCISRGVFEADGTGIEDIEL